MVTLIIDSCCDFVKTSDRTPRGGLKGTSPTQISNKNICASIKVNVQYLLILLGQEGRVVLFCVSGKGGGLSFFEEIWV